MERHLLDINTCLITQSFYEGTTALYSMKMKPAPSTNLLTDVPSFKVEPPVSVSHFIDEFLSGVIVILPVVFACRVTPFSVIESNRNRPESLLFSCKETGNRKTVDINCGQNDDIFFSACLRGRKDTDYVRAKRKRTQPKSFEN